MRCTLTASLVLGPRSRGDASSRCTKYRVGVRSGAHIRARSGESWRQRRSVLWAVRSSVAVVQVGEDFGDLQWQRLRESTAAVRTFGVLSGESYRRSPPRFFHGVNSRPRGFADLGDGVTTGKIIPTLFYVAIFCFGAPLGCCNFLLVFQSFPRALLVCG